MPVVFDVLIIPVIASLNLFGWNHTGKISTRYISVFTKLVTYKICILITLNISNLLCQFTSLIQQTSIYWEGDIDWCVGDINAEHTNFLFLLSIDYVLAWAKTIKITSKVLHWCMWGGFVNLHGIIYQESQLFDKTLPGKQALPRMSRKWYCSRYKRHLKQAA